MKDLTLVLSNVGLERHRGGSVEKISYRDIQLLQQFETGQGDYTTDRHTWFGKRTVRELVEEIER